MANNREISQFAGLVTVNDTTNQVSLGSTLVVPSGKIGIGTDNPTAVFHVVDANDFVKIERGSADISINANYSGLNEKAQIQSSQALAIASGGDNERIRFTSNGKTLVGATTPRTAIPGGTIGIQIEGTSTTNTQNRFVQHIYGEGGTAGPYLGLGKHRASSIGSTTIINAVDELGGIYFHGADGASMVQGAYILAQADAAVGINSMPGRLVLATTPADSQFPSERVRIDSRGNTTVGGSVQAYNSGVINSFAMGGSDSPWRRYYFFGGGGNRTLVFSGDGYFARIRVVGYGNYTPNISEAEFIAGGRGSSLGHSHQVTQIGSRTDTSISVSTSDSGSTRTYTLTIAHTEGLNKNFNIEVEMYGTSNFSLS